MNSKKKHLTIIVSIVATLIVASVTAGALVLVKGDTRPEQQTPTTQQGPTEELSPETYTDQADAAYIKGDYSKSITLLEKAEREFKAQNNQQKADETHERIEAIKALRNAEAKEPLKEAPPVAPTSADLSS